MKRFGGSWWVFALIGTASAYLNPYVGMFGLFNFVEFFILICMMINIVFRVKAFEKNGYDNRLRIEIRAAGIAIYIMAIAFFFLNLFASGVVFLLAFTDKNPATPFRIWSNPDSMSVILLLIEFVFCILLLVSLICKGITIRRLVKNHAKNF
ncbi:hypothetical protein [Clostridium felsineum]|uniref:hypothetical protein n=1 Tax=Clostridium felsineum TaxID=36839 RepID=UPI0009CC592F|nr:hypothetical protein [Clostridium felsineum]URZ14416.1 hypothetical protein CLFE_004130 [Clostridium felsineum DSM 794]